MVCVSTAVIHSAKAVASSKLTPGCLSGLTGMTPYGLQQRRVADYPRSSRRQPRWPGWAGWPAAPARCRGRSGYRPVFRWQTAASRPCPAQRKIPARSRRSASGQRWPTGSSPLVCVPESSPREAKAASAAATAASASLMLAEARNARRISCRADQDEVVVHHVQPVDAVARFHKRVFAGARMYQDHVGVAVGRPARWPAPCPPPPRLRARCTSSQSRAGLWSTSPSRRCSWS